MIDNKYRGPLTKPVSAVLIVGMLLLSQPI